MGTYLSSKKRTAAAAKGDAQLTTRLSRKDAQLEAHNIICGPCTFVEFSKISDAYGGKRNFAIVEMAGGGKRREMRKQLGGSRATVLEVGAAGPPKLHCSQCDKLIATREGDVKRPGNKPFYVCVNCRLVGRKVHLCSSCHTPPDKAEVLKTEILASTHTYQKYSLPAEPVASEPGTLQGRRTSKKKGARQRKTSSLSASDPVRHSEHVIESLKNIQTLVSPKIDKFASSDIPRPPNPAETAKTNPRFSSAVRHSTSESSSNSSSSERSTSSTIHRRQKLAPAPTPISGDVPMPFEEAPTAPDPDSYCMPKPIRRRRWRRHRSRGKMKRAVSKDSDGSNLSQAVLLAQPADSAQHIAYIPTGAEVNGTGENRGDYVKVQVSLHGQVMEGWLRIRNLRLQSGDCHMTRDAADLEPAAPEPLPRALNVAEAGFLPGTVHSMEGDTTSPRPSSAGSRHSDPSSDRNSQRSSRSDSSRASSSVSETDPGPSVRERPISYRKGGSWE